jgi:uncharacterized protein involved in response to NO
MALMTIDPPSVPGRPSPDAAIPPLLRLGFRPFYLLAAVFAAIGIPVWMSVYRGAVPAIGNVSMLWHVHEMVFGFAVAVVIGFLYTAARNWTGLWTPRGTTLGLLAGLWLAGRVAVAFANPMLAAIVDLAFLPSATWPIYRVLQRTGNKRNMALVALLGVLTLANALYHAAMLGWAEISPLAPLQAGILVIVMIESILGGRVIPGFTRNAVQGSDPVVHERRDRVCLALTLGACLAWLADIAAPLTAALAAAAAAAQFLRLLGWQPWKTAGTPLLWILHLSYAWIPFGFALLACSALGFAPSSAAFHALAVGSIAGLILGMMTRTTLGHTGRRLQAGRQEVVMYLLIQAGALTRLLAALNAGGLYVIWLDMASLFWTAAFVLFIAVYGRYLATARTDGREG